MLVYEAVHARMSRQMSWSALSWYSDTSCKILGSTLRAVVLEVVFFPVIFPMMLVVFTILLTLLFVWACLNLFTIAAIRKFSVYNAIRMPVSKAQMPRSRPAPLNNSSTWSAINNYLSNIFTIYQAYDTSLPAVSSPPVDTTSKPIANIASAPAQILSSLPSSLPSLPTLQSAPRPPSVPVSNAMNAALQSIASLTNSTPPVSLPGELNVTVDSQSADLDNILSSALASSQPAPTSWPASSWLSQ